MTIPSRWFITRSAMDDYRRIVARDIDDAQVLIELAPLTERAHQVKQFPNGNQLWRGRAINRHRLRLIVGAPRPPHNELALIAVLPSHDALEPPPGP